jgi:hypothetical protein
LRKVATQLSKNTSLIARWSSQNSWVARCEAWDAHLNELAVRELERDRVAMAKRHSRAGQLFVQQATLKAAALGLTPEEIDKRVSVNEATAMLLAGSKIERLARGLGELVEQRHTGAPLVTNTINLSAMVLADRSGRLAEMATELMAELAAQDEARDRAIDGHALPTPEPEL